MPIDGNIMDGLGLDKSLNSIGRNAGLENGSTKAAPPGQNGTRAMLSGVLASPDAFGTTLLVWCVETWGTECLHDPDDPDRGPWHPDTFRSMLEQQCGVTLPPANLDRLMAAVAVVTTDLFFRSITGFIRLANVLSGDAVDPDEFEKADAGECAWAITEALLLHPPEDGEELFSEEIRHYLAHVLRDEGFVTPPDVLRLAIDGDDSAKVAYEFADDPAMFSMIHQVQADKTADVEDAIRTNLTHLLAQLKTLPLQHGRVDELEKQVERALAASRAKAPPETGPEHVL